jgi:hypothetical protein
VSRLAQTSDIDRACRDRVPHVVVGVASLEENREIGTLKQHTVRDESPLSNRSLENTKSALLDRLSIKLLIARVLMLLVALDNY